MDFVDLQRRREERARASREPETLRRRVVRDPLLLLGTGFVLGALSPSILHYFFYPEDPGFLSTTMAVVTLALACYAGWLLLRKRPGQREPKLGSGKQLLGAIQDAGGTITPVEAALETSLTVDEAEDILTSLANRGHLVVQSRGAALLYTLTGRRPGADPRIA